MDINKAALLIAILALVFAVPLSIIANLLTPKMRSWYAATTPFQIQVVGGVLSADNAVSSLLRLNAISFNNETAC